MHNELHKHTRARAHTHTVALSHPERVSTLQVELPLSFLVVVDEKARVENEKASLEGLVEAALLLHVARHKRLAELERESSSLWDRR